VHVSAFPRGRRPAVNERVTYLAARDRQHRWRAEAVSFQRPAVLAPRARRLLQALGGTVLFFAFLVAVILLGHASWPLLGVYGLLSVVTFTLYGRDKAAARQGRWRTAESTLHLLGLVGGWPGALAAQRFFRHKTKKPWFQAIFWCAVIINCAALWWLLYGDVTASLRTRLGIG
jgi:uncharacterized membrane protein YsdA (DUF1294 family)